MFGVLKQIVWQIERSFSSHFARRKEWDVKAPKAISGQFIGLRCGFQ
jgi:hypothetical protein